MIFELTRFPVEICTSRIASAVGFYSILLFSVTGVVGEQFGQIVITCVLMCHYCIVYTVSTTRNEWIHWRRTKNSGGHSEWNGKPGNYPVYLINKQQRPRRWISVFNSCFLLLLSENYNFEVTTMTCVPPVSCNSITRTHYRKTVLSRQLMKKSYMQCMFPVHIRVLKDYVGLFHFTELCTVFFMALQLKLNKLERTELDASLRNKSEKCEELVEEVKHSR